MGQTATIESCYVIKAGELTALNFLADNYVRPRTTEWINRGTDQKLRPTTINLLLRTFFQNPVSPSIAQLRESTGLRLTFRSQRERNQFAANFAQARENECGKGKNMILAIFGERDRAEMAVSDLVKCGLPAQAVALLSRAGQFMETGRQWPEGHSPLSVAKAVAGGGIFSALLGAGILAIPGIGAASLIGGISAASGTIGATGAAIAKMLTDVDVDDIAAKSIEQQFRTGKVFVSVDLELAADRSDLVTEILLRYGGQIDLRSGERQASMLPSR